MIWLLNNDPGPSGINQNDNDDQPGPSGITVIQLKEITQSKLENQQKNNSNQIEKDDDSEDEEKEISPIKQFAENVTIAGLYEAYHSHILAVRIMFRVALIFTFFMITLQAIAIVRRYMSQDTISVDTELINYQAPFPTIYVCFKPKMNEDLLYGYKNEMPRQIRKRLQKYGVSFNEITDFMKRALFMEGDARDIQKVSYLAARTFYDASIGLSSKDGRSLIWDLVYQNCSQILSNCNFNGRPFDCCEAAKFFFGWKYSCFNIMSTKIDQSDIDPLRIQDAGLSFDVNTDWTNNYDSDGSASDGYNIFIQTLPDLTKVPTHVPANMDVFIMLAQPKKIEEQTQCRHESRILKYFDYYDSEGLLCLLDKMTDIVLKLVGCYMPVWSFFPIDNVCTFAPNFVMSIAISNAGIDKLLLALTNFTVQKPETDGLEILKYLISRDTPCKPLCSRWAYPVLSSSYGSIQYKNDSIRKAQLANRSWSRIKVILPQSSTSHKEERKAAHYLAFCGVGGMMSAWAGFSVITFAGILAYGFQIVRSKWKKRNQVQPEKKLQRKKVIAKSNCNAVQTDF